MWRSGKGRRGRAGSAPRPGFESEALETRRLFGFHTVNGTDGDDTIVVDFVAVRDNFLVNEYHVTLNGRRQVIGGTLFLTVRGLDGKDTITVNKTRPDHGVDVFGNSGDDTITIGGGDVDRNIFPSLVEGDGGNDTVIVDDRNHVGFGTYRIAVGLPGPGIDLHFGENDSNRIALSDDVQVLRLLCPNNVTTTNVREFESMQLDRLEIRGGTNSDRVNYVRSSGNAVLDFNGGGGDFDHIDYTDKRFNTSNRTATLDTGSFQFDGALRATFTNHDSLVFEIDGLNDTFNVNGLAAGVSARVDASAGHDTYNIGGGDYDANVRGSILVFDSGNADTRDERDTIAFHDTTGTTPDVYHITSHQFSKDGDPGDSDFQIFNPDNDDLIYNLSGGANVINWDPSFAPNRVTINAGGGADTVNVGAGSLAGPDMTLRGEAGTDQVVFQDDGRQDAAVLDKDYTFSGGFLRYLQNNVLNAIYDYDFEAVTLNSGPQNSTFTVASTGGEATLVLNGGDGTDRLPLLPANAGATSIVFNGEGGSDVIDIDDTGDTIADPYLLTTTAFDKTVFSLLTYATVESLVLRGHTAQNNFAIDGVAAGTAVRIVAGNSIDSFRVGAGDLDSNISGTLEIVGEQGGDTVLFDDTADTGNDTYRLDGDGVLTKANVPAQTMQYRFVEHVELNANPGNNTFVVASVGFALDLTLRGFNGADTFDITPSDRADIRIEASDPTVPPGDVLRFSNAGIAGPVILTPNGAVNGTYTFAFAEPVTFFGIETFPTPPAAPAVPDLAANTDTGASNADNITAAPTLALGGRAPAGATVALYDGGTLVATQVASAEGAYAFFVLNAGEGTHSYAAAVRLEPSQLTGAPSVPLSVTVDRTAPVAPDAPDLDAASDTGPGNADNYTADTTPTFTGRAATGTRVFLESGIRTLGSATATGSLYSITSLALSDGVHPVRARLQDIAGNTSAAGATVDVTVDTAAPAVALTTFTAQSQSRLVYHFSEDVPNLASSSLTLVDLGTGAPLPPALVRLDYQPNTATFTFNVTGQVLPAGSYRATLSGGTADRAGNALAEPRVFDFNVFAKPTGRRVFANNSAADGNNPAPTAADDAAIIAGKLPLLPGQSPFFVHVTSYSKGLNGVQLDLSKLPAAVTPTVGDFETHVVNAAGGLTAVTPSGILVRRGAGLLGSDRVTLTLPDGTARNAWLRVTIKANANTGLASPDVFFYGNLVGDAGGVGLPIVNTVDLAGTRAAVGSTTLAVLSRFDFNRDGVINALDVLLARNNQRRTLPPPIVAPAVAPAPAPAGAGAPDVLTSAPRRDDARPGLRGVWDGLTSDGPA